MFDYVLGMLGCRSVSSTTEVRRSPTSFMKAKHMKTDSGTCNPSGPGQPRSEGVDEGVAEYLV